MIPIRKLTIWAKNTKTKRIIFRLSHFSGIERKGREGFARTPTFKDYSALLDL